ncbi:MAG TPA: putative nucleotide-diphospho-sugar transferase [Gemmataceae bacterium]|jgi:hypothetical protein|nr:putative nucleotide-diphospho-sugar transferase [Gemmataceae bacterium]
MAADHHDKSSRIITSKVPLPVCRWRKETAHGHICHSTKFVNSPNIVPAAFCASCCYADHEPPRRLPRALPCVHLGPLVKNAVDRGRDPASADEVFACALHGRCTIANGKHAQVRSCGSCGDYLRRDPFGPDSAQMWRQAEEFLRAVPPYPQGRYEGRGVIIAAGDDGCFPGLYVTIRALRHLGCRLPIQVWYLGRKREMSAKRKALLAPFQVECVDADKVRRRHHPARRLDGWELKVFATLHSPFEEVLFLDADCYPCRNPEFLFELEDYRAQGAICWPDVNATDARLKWPAFGLASPRRLGCVDSDQFLVHKELSWQPLNLAWFYHDHFDNYYRYCGDKHILEVAWTHCARPFVMWEARSRGIDVGCLQNGPDHLPLFVNRCVDKFSFESHRTITPQHKELPSFCSALPLEHECREWLAELARLMGQTRVFSRMMAIKELPRCRWRKTLGDGAILCFSEKYVASPNRVALDMCRMCPFPDHEAASVYQAHNPIPLGPWTAAPYCVYEPTKIRTRNKGTLAIATLYTPEIAELGLLTSQAMRAYAERHGYTAVVGRSQLGFSRHPYWSKVVLIEHYFSNNPSCKWLMWMDTDVVITNPEKRLEDFLERDVDFLVAEDPGTPINSGVFMVRNCAATIYLLRRAYAKTQYLTHPTPEQMALSEALHESGTTVNTRVVSRRLFNSFAKEHRKGDFIIHFAGWPAKMKLAAAKKAIASARAMLAKPLPTKKRRTTASRRPS